jgi:hypothetical protein
VGRVAFNSNGSTRIGRVSVGKAYRGKESPLPTTNNPTMEKKRAKTIISNERKRRERRE